MVISDGQHRFVRTRARTTLPLKVTFRLIWRVSKKMSNVLWHFEEEMEVTQSWVQILRDGEMQEDIYWMLRPS